MKARKIISIICVILPLVLAAAGFYAFLTQLGKWDEGGEFFFLLFWIIPIVCACTVPLAVTALILNRKPKVLFVTIAAIAELVLSVPPVLLYTYMYIISH